MTQRLQRDKQSLEEQRASFGAEQEVLGQKIAKLETEIAGIDEKMQKVNEKLQITERALLQQKGAIVAYWNDTLVVNPPVKFFDCTEWKTHPKDTHPKLSEHLATKFTLILHELKQHAFLVPGFLCQVDLGTLKDISASFVPDEKQVALLKKCPEIIPVLNPELPSSVEVDLQMRWSLGFHHRGMLKLERFSDKSGRVHIGEQEYQAHGQKILEIKRFEESEGRIYGEPRGFIHESGFIASEDLISYVDILCEILLSQLRKYPREIHY